MYPLKYLDKISKLEQEKEEFMAKQIDDPKNSPFAKLPDNESSPVENFVSPQKGNWRIGQEVRKLETSKIGTIQEIIDDTYVIVDYGLYSKKENGFLLEEVC